MALFSHAISWSANCQPWQLWWHISATTRMLCVCVSLWLCICWRHQDRLRGAIKTAKVGSSMDTLGCGWNVPSELPRFAVCWPRDHLAEKCQWRLIRCHQNCHREAVLMALHQNWLRSGRNVPLELPRLAVLWPNHYHGRKVPLELPRSAVLWSDHRTAKGGSSNPQKKVWIELPRLAVLIALFKTAYSDSCSQVIVQPFHMKMCMSGYKRQN